MRVSTSHHLLLALLCLFPLLLATAMAAAVGDASPNTTSTIVYAGTYTNAKSKGIYAWRMDNTSGALTSIGLVAETPNPTFIQIAPNHRFLYAVNELNNYDGKSAGSVSAFSIDAASGKLTLISVQTSGGAGPCHLTLDKTGKNVLVANYNGGSIECLPAQEDGRLGAPTGFIQNSGRSIKPDRQAGPHAHCMVMDPDNHFAFACDLGLDKVFSFRFDAGKGTLEANDPPFTSTKLGAGPRHMVFHPNGHQAYVINEIDSTISRYSYDPATAELTEMQTVPLLPPTFNSANTAAEIAVHPSGRFLYGSNRGDDSIIVFIINQETGNLTFLQRISTQGKTPRNFAIDPSGRLLFAANQNSDNIVIYDIDPGTGELSPTGTTLDAPAPACIQFLPPAAVAP